MAQLAGVHPRTMTNLDDGTFSLADLENKVRTLGQVARCQGAQVPRWPGDRLPCARCGLMTPTCL